MPARLAEINQDELVRGRLARLRRSLAKADVAGALLSDPMNIRYATGTRNMSVWTMHGPGRYAFVSTDGPVVLFEFGSSKHVEPRQSPVIPPTAVATGTPWFDVPVWSSPVDMRRLPASGGRSDRPRQSAWRRATGVWRWGRSSLGRVKTSGFTGGIRADRRAGVARNGARSSKRPRICCAWLSRDALATTRMDRMRAACPGTHRKSVAVAREHRS